VSWWRENRFWLPALPVALAAMLLASSYHVRYFWYDAGLHDRVASGAAQQRVSATIDYDDEIGATSRTFEVELIALGTAAVYPFEGEDEPVPPPEGVDAVVAHLDWAAAPDQVLRFCTVSLVDAQGRRYDTEPGRVEGCTPEGREGPYDAGAGAVERGLVPPGEERPETWSTAPVILVPHGREITRVLVWWSTPDYVELSAS
jgi:hypothetical protein